MTDPDPTKFKPIPKPQEQEKLSSPAERNKKIWKILSGLYESLSDEELNALLEEVQSRVEYLRGKYSNHINYKILHVLSGSGIHDLHSGVIEDDFPGDDSVEKFVDDLAKKYIK